MERRSFLRGALAGVIGAFAPKVLGELDEEVVDKLLWTPGQKTIFLPSEATTLIHVPETAHAFIVPAFRTIRSFGMDIALTRSDGLVAHYTSLGQNPRFPSRIYDMNSLKTWDPKTMADAYRQDPTIENNQELLKKWNSEKPLGGYYETDYMKRWRS